MIYIQWLLVATFIVIGFVGGYYLLQMYSNSKEGKLFSIFTGGWLFHPEYLKENGLIYRKKLIGCLVLGVFLVTGILLFG